MINNFSNQSKSSFNNHKALDRPVHLGAMASQLESTSNQWKSIWTSSKEIDSKVDVKKLEKAEAKLKLKQEKREGDEGKDKPSFQVIKEASVNQMISKKDVKQESRGTNRTKDIKIENFDLAFGDHILLKSAELTMGFGRRYGLCGRNGIGKSTLLRMISNGSLMIPKHITILHVEQEVIGDDTTALNSVLECDELRNGLLQEEKQLTGKKITF